VGEGVQARGAIQFRQDHQIQQTVINQRVRAQRHATSSLPAITDRNGHETSLPREAFRTKAAAVRRQFRKARDAGEHVGHSPQSPLELRIRFYRDTRAEAARDEVHEWLAVEEA
jgi:hypothetical protein